ncbi:MAG: hypothetical protein OXP36_12100 [Gammaproteobacteria bacterium]|nr:hypothetical protein [Gammaproteobacteria bacterium]
MTDSSVFAHVVLRNNAPEPTATLALEYLLGQEDALAKFAELWPEEIREKVKPRRVESETTHGDEDARPDLSIYDDSNTCRVLVENKFWAGLTPHQPVKYLEELPADGAGAMLLFIVPKDRVSTVWQELKLRCGEEKVGNERHAPDPLATLPNGRILAITSWRRVLENLSTVRRIEADVAQLRVLTDRMNADAFLPLRQEELTNQQTPTRMINYADLVLAIAEKLKTRRVASTKGLRPSHGYHTTGRYLLLRDRIGIWLGVDLRFWKKEGSTPIWCHIWSGEWYGVDPIWTQFEQLFGQDVVVDPNSRSFPIALKTGVEYESVIDAAADRLTQIADALVQALDDLE